MYKIKRAIILAAGHGSRLRPYTDKTPKPLLPVDGKPIIERTIEYLISRCIIDITIVVGYRARQFKYLKKKYGVKLVRNRMFARGTNLLSLKKVVDKIEDCVILDADTLLKGQAVKKQVPYSGYSYVKEKCAKEWEIKIDGRGFIKEVIADLTEKHDFNALHSISYWVGEDAKKYQKAIKEAKDVNIDYVDDIAVTLPIDLKAYEIKHSDIYEIDTVEEYENAIKDKRIVE